jgi:hypothetical protein
MKRAYNLNIGERMAEEIKIRIGSAAPLDEEITMEVKGSDSVAGLPKTLHITSQEIREAMMDPLSSIVEVVRLALEKCPPELSADLVDRGFVLAGGGSLIRTSTGSFRTPRACPSSSRKTRSPPSPRARASSSRTSTGTRRARPRRRSYFLSGNDALPRNCRTLFSG